MAHIGRPTSVTGMPAAGSDTASGCWPCEAEQEYAVDVAALQVALDHRRPGRRAPPPPSAARPGPAKTSVAAEITWAKNASAKNRLLLVQTTAAADRTRPRGVDGAARWRT